MRPIHPLDTLQGYRLGSRQATVELQRSDAPGIHIPFKVLQLVEDIRQRPGQAVILTGTAGDGKTYLAYRVIDALGLARDAVLAAQAGGGYDQDGIFLDLDLSAGPLTDARVNRLQQVLAAPGRCTLLCANEGKLAELQMRFEQRSLAVPADVRIINLSRRALVGTEGWARVLSGVLDGPIWGADGAVAADSPLAWNRHWLRDANVAERLRRYLLLPYLLGEPITVRETLSFLAYALGGGLDPASEAGIAASGAEEPDRLPADKRRISYLLFNTVFSEPGGYMHGGRGAPGEKLLAWLFRFDPADQASPEVDLRLLVELNTLDAEPPAELRQMWSEQLVQLPTEPTDTPYRDRLQRFMRYARRWYALASDEGFSAFFPFRHFESYLRDLAAPADGQWAQVPNLLRGLNLLLSDGRADADDRLQLFYLVADDTRHATIFTSGAGAPEEDFSIASDDVLDQGTSAAGDRYLELLPRRLYLVYERQPEIRLPVSLLLYEVLLSAASPRAGFPATLWARERDTVVRFMNALNGAAGPAEGRPAFRIQDSEQQSFEVTYNPGRRRLTIS